MPGHQMRNLAASDFAGRELRPEVAEQLYRQAHIRLQQCPYRIVVDAAADKLQRRYPQAFLEDVGRLRRDAAPRPAFSIIGPPRRCAKLRPKDANPARGANLACGEMLLPSLPS